MTLTTVGAVRTLTGSRDLLASNRRALARAMPAPWEILGARHYTDNPQLLLFRPNFTTLWIETVKWLRRIGVCVRLQECDNLSNCSLPRASAVLPPGREAFWNGVLGH